MNEYCHGNDDDADADDGDNDDDDNDEDDAADDVEYGRMNTSWIHSANEQLKWQISKNIKIQTRAL